MGFFSNPFSHKKEEADPTAQALRHFIDEKLPKSYVNSKKYAVSITQKESGYTAKITLDMCADGSDYSTFGPDDYMGLASMESSYLFDTFLIGAPVSVSILFEMIFDAKNCITINAGKTPAR